MKKETNLKDTVLNTTEELLNAITTTMVTINDALQIVELSAKIAKTELAEIYITNNKALLDKLKDEEKNRYSKFLN